MSNGSSYRTAAASLSPGSRAAAAAASAAIGRKDGASVSGGAVGGVTARYGAAVALLTEAHPRPVSGARAGSLSEARLGGATGGKGLAGGAALSGARTAGPTSLAAVAQLAPLLVSYAIASGRAAATTQAASAGAPRSPPALAAAAGPASGARSLTQSLSFPGPVGAAAAAVASAGNRFGEPAAAAAPPSLDEIAAYPPAREVIASACAAAPQGPLMVSVPGRGVVHAAELLAPGSAAAALDAIRVQHPRLAPPGGGATVPPESSATLAGGRTKGRRDSTAGAVDDAAAVAALARARSVRSPWVPDDVPLPPRSSSTRPGSSIAYESNRDEVDASGHNRAATWGALRGVPEGRSTATAATRMRQSSPAAVAEAYIAWRREHEHERERGGPI